MRLLNSVKRYVHSCTTDSKYVTFIPHYNMKLLSIIIGKEQPDRNKYVELTNEDWPGCYSINNQLDATIAIYY